MKQTAAMAMIALLLSNALNAFASTTVLNPPDATNHPTHAVTLQLTGHCDDEDCDYEEDCYYEEDCRDYDGSDD